MAKLKEQTHETPFDFWNIIEIRRTTAQIGSRRKRIAKSKKETRETPFDFFNSLNWKNNCTNRKLEKQNRQIGNTIVWNNICFCWKLAGWWKLFPWAHFHFPLHYQYAPDLSQGQPRVQKTFVGPDYVFCCRAVGRREPARPFIWNAIAFLCCNGCLKLLCTGDAIGALDKKLYGVCAVYAVHAVCGACICCACCMCCMQYIYIYIYIHECSVCSLCGVCSVCSVYSVYKACSVYNVYRVFFHDRVILRSWFQTETLYRRCKIALPFRF